MTTTRIELTVADLVARLRESIQTDSAPDYLVDAAAPHVSAAANKERHDGLLAGIRGAAKELGAIADDDYRALSAWCWRWDNTLANACGRFGGAHVAAAFRQLEPDLAGVRPPVTFQLAPAHPA